MRQPRTSKALSYPPDAGGPDKAAAAKANQACHSCKRQKRKCDKALPACGLCTRMSRTCDYSDVPPAPTAEDIMTLQLKLFELESRLNSGGGADSRTGRLDALDCGGSHSGDSVSRSSHTPQPLPRESLWEGGNSGFPPTVFLDRDLFRRAGLYIPRPLYNVPSDIFQCIGDRDSVQQGISDYFDDIYPWLPMVTKKRMSLDSASWDGGVDLPLLYLAMKLITSQPQIGFEAAENYLYTASKRVLSLLESIGTASILYLQALILVALYEYGQGIYPAAWMTVGQCVRYADFLGISSGEDSNDILGQCATWVEIEERRRTWWAVYVLDKLVSTGSRKRPLYDEPPPTETLPVSDGAWELGDIDGAIQSRVSSPSPFTEHQSTFGRLCQGALLVSRMLEQSRRAETCRLTGTRFDHSEAASLIESAHALGTSIEAEMVAQPGAYFSLIPAQCLAYSAMMKTLDIPTMESRSMWAEDDLSLRMAACIEGGKKTLEKMRDLVRDLSSIASLDEQVVKTSPLVLDAVYSAATGTGTSGSAPASEMARKVLARLGVRWRLGVEYLRALDHHEMIDAMIGQGFGCTSSDGGSGSGSQTMTTVPIPVSIAAMPTIVC